MPRGVKKIEPTGETPLESIPEEAPVIPQSSSGVVAESFMTVFNHNTLSFHKGQKMIFEAPLRSFIEAHGLPVIFE